MSLDPQHPHHHHIRRIHRKARVIHYWLAPLTLLVVPAWIYVAYGLCEEDANGVCREAVCRLLRAMPFAPVLAALVLLAFIVRDLAAVGVDEHVRVHGVHPGGKRLKHAAHGWRSIGHDHRRHVRWAVVQVVAVAAAVFAWLAWTAWRTTR